MAEDNGDKSEQPTDRRREETRERGNVARSVDLNAAASVMATAAVLHFMGGDIVSALVEVQKKFLAVPAWDHLDVPMLMGHLWSVGETLFRGVAPALATLFVTAVAINFLQVGFMITTESLQPNFGRLNPLEGAQRILSVAGLVRLAGSLLKLIVLCSVVIGFVSSRLPMFLRGMEISLGPFGTQTGNAMATLAFQIAMALAVLAVLDYGFHLWKFEQDLKMTKQEVRDEMRHMDGDPLIRQRRKEAHKKLVAAQQIQQVREADVVITNPTEIAVAIKYDSSKMAAPIVVAKGRDELATRIRRVAVESGVPIVEKKPLARALYRDVKIGHPVPTKFYEAVAEILAYVYRLSGKRVKSA